MSSSISSSRQPRSRTGQSGQPDHSRYLLALAVGLSALLAQFVLPNVRVDPFWFFGGNDSWGGRFAFETREAKLNRLRATTEQRYDCLLSGSSRALTVDSTAFAEHHCFNLAVEGATLPESIALYERASEIVPSPRLVIQAVDNFDFEAETCSDGLERATLQRREPRHRWYERYASIDVLRFSRKVAQGRVRGVSYDRDWRPVLDRFEPYEPSWDRLAQALAARPLGIESQKRYSNACVGELERLRQLFPNARLTGYVSPIAADLVLRMHIEGQLPHYLDGVQSAASHFDAFYDFSAPSELTFDTTHTWDGSHYDPSISGRLAEILLGRGDGSVALRVDELSGDAYRALYGRRLRDMLARLDELSSAAAAGGAD